MGENSVNFSFNKGQQINIGNFDGVSKEELIKKAGGENTQQGRLIASIFGRYDNGDGFLSADEYNAMQADLVRFAKDDNLGGRELKKFNANLSTTSNTVDKNAYSMEDLQSVVGMMTAGTDRVTGVVTQGNKVTVSYNPEMSEGVTEEVYEDKILLKRSSNLQYNLEFEDGVVLTDAVKTFTYDDNGKFPIKSVIKGSSPNSPVMTCTYAGNAEDGGDFLSMEYTYVNREGNVKVTCYTDEPNIGKPSQKVTTKPDNSTEIIDYMYTEDGVTETYRDAEGGKPTKIVVKDAQGNVVSTKTYTYDGDKSTEIEETGTGDDAVRTRTVRNGNKLESFVNVDAEGNVQDSTHTVKPGDSWYGIVQAKYGVTDHRTTMEIVHKLKENAGVRRFANTMPAEITLPAEVTLASGTKVALKNTDALVNMTHNVANAPRITPPQALAQADLPQPIEALTAEQQQITIPTYEVNTANAGKTVAVEGGQYYRYDNAGRVINVYVDEAHKNAGNNSVRIKYDAQGNVTEYQQNSDDEQGHWMGAIQYDGTGAFKDRWVNDQFDPDHPKQYGRQTKYNADGSINYILDNYQYDEQGRILSYDNFNSDGSWLCSRKLDYGNDGTCQTRFYKFDDRGRMTEIESFE